MIGLQDFIIQVDKEFQDTFKTEGGIELYADKRFSQDKLATRIATVQEAPKFYNGPIKKGMQVFIDHTIFLRETYRNNGTVENIYTIDKQSGTYKIQDELIFMYRENESAPWKCNNDNIFVEEVIEEAAEEKIGSIIIAPSKPIRKGIHVVVYDNKALNDLGVKKGNKVIVNEKLRMPISIEGKQYYQLNNKDIFAVYKN